MLLRVNLISLIISIGFNSGFVKLFSIGKQILLVLVNDFFTELVHPVNLCTKFQVFALSSMNVSR